MNKTYKTEVYCTLQIEGTHNWSECPFDEVNYLRMPHRHTFHIKAYKEVNHSDRDVEFIILKRQITEYLLDSYADWDNENRFLHIFDEMSCEMIAEILIRQFNLSRCEVSEDGENGAIISQYDPAILG